MVMLGKDLSGNTGDPVNGTSGTGAVSLIADTATRVYGAYVFELRD